VIAHIDIGLVPVDFFTAVELVPDEGQLTENPAPYIKKEISHGAEAKEKRKCKAREKQDHEDRKDEANPKDVKAVEEGTNYFQNKLLKTA
jgi:hypothetical protein